MSLDLEPIEMVDEPLHWPQKHAYPQRVMRSEERPEHQQNLRRY
jgi:hypothetical protein